MYWDASSDTIRQMSSDHTAASASERVRVESRAYVGVVEDGRLCGVLEPTRSIGDLDIKDLIATRRGVSIVFVICRLVRVLISFV